MSNYRQVYLWVVAVACILALLGILYDWQTARGAEDFSICRDTSYGTPRYEVHGYEPDMLYFAEGVAMDLDTGILYADGLTQETIEHYSYQDLGLYAGEVLIYRGNLETVGIGDENTAPCGQPTEPPETPKNTSNLTLRGDPQPVLSTGRTCTVKYPQIVLVCSG